MMAFIALTWQRFAGYLVVVGGALVSAFLLYRKGNVDARRDLELSQRRLDADNASRALSIRSDLPSDSGAVGSGLRRWQRQGP